QGKVLTAMQSAMAGMQQQSNGMAGEFSRRMQELSARSEALGTAAETAQKLAGEQQQFASLRGDMSETFHSTVKALNEAVESYALAAEAMQAQSEAARNAVQSFDEGAGAELSTLNYAASALKDVVEQTKGEVLDSTVRITNRAETFEQGLDTLSKQAEQGLGLIQQAAAALNQRGEAAGGRMDGAATRIEDIHTLLARALGNIDEKADRLAEIKSQIVRSADAMDRGSEFTRRAMAEILDAVRKDSDEFRRLIQDMANDAAANGRNGQGTGRPTSDGY
ncbi:MAG: hypothetical protein AAGH45_10330, partial [Pseudomonadota bacterium]